MDTRKLTAVEKYNGNGLPTGTYRLETEPGISMGNVNGMIDPDVEQLVKRWNAYPELIAKLQELELRATQARIASNIGRPTLKDADFLRTELERIGQAARNLLNTLIP